MTQSEIFGPEVEVLDLQLIKYRLDIFTLDQITPIATGFTWGGWCIEGDFLCTWNREGLKEAARIDKEICRIMTTEMPSEESKLKISEEVNVVDEEADNPQVDMP